MKRIKHYLLIALAFPLALALVACTSTAPAAKDGSYIGEAEGKGGKIVVQVNLARDRIDHIQSF